MLKELLYIFKRVPEDTQYGRAILKKCSITDEYRLYDK